VDSYPGIDESSAGPANPSVARVPTAAGATMTNSQEQPRGRYLLLKELGRGAMGTVYLALDTLAQRQVALKMPHFQPGASPELRERFYREVRAAAMFDHPNICPLYDVGEEDGRPYLTMAYIEGQTLADVLRACNPMPQRRAVEIVAKLARGVEEMHRHGVVHRHLTPSNVMVKRRGEPVIMDFGLAKRDQDASITNQGPVLRTPAYMPREQVNGETAKIGPASDQYALGVILYELFTGQVPFRGTVEQVMAKILTEAPKPPSWVQPDLDPALEEVCLKAMAAEIPDRFPSVGDFAEALERFLTPTGTKPDIGLPVVLPGSSPDVPRTDFTGDTMLSAPAPPRQAPAPPQRGILARLRTWLGW
jgi:serine/threonine protein kinase